MESNLANNMLSFPGPISAEAELVRSALQQHGLETPLIHNGLDRDEKYQRIVAAFTDITLSLIHISEPTRQRLVSRMPSSA